MLRSKADQKAELLAANTLSNQKYKRRFTKTSPQPKSLADSPIKSETTTIEQPKPIMKPLTTTDDTGQPIEIKPINTDNLPAQFKFIKIKVQRPPKTNQRIVISK